MKYTVTREKLRNVRKDIENRKEYIGGSDIGSILGLNPYKSEYTLWAEKTGLIEPEDVSDKDAVWLGTMTEEINGKRFTMKTGKRISRSKVAYGVKEYPFIRCHVDFLVRGESAGVECKFTGYNGFNYEQGEIPPQHYAQMQMYMLCTGRKRWYLATIQANKYFVNSVDRDDEFIEMMLKKAQEFWDHVQSAEPVEVDGEENTADTLAKLYPNEEPGTVIDLSKDEDTLLALQEIGTQEKNLKTLKTQYQNTIKSLLGDAERGETGQFTVTWKTNAKGSRVFRMVEKPL